MVRRYRVASTYYKESLAPDNITDFVNHINEDDADDYLPPVPPLLERVWGKKKTKTFRA